MPDAISNYIIAIGASAGGLEEINLFFDHTPSDGVSYVIVQHLSPVFKSHMVELLAKHSKLLVVEAANEMVVKANQVYLTPTNKYMTITNGKLYLTNKTAVKGPHLTINTFLESLAINSAKRPLQLFYQGLDQMAHWVLPILKKPEGW